MKQLLLEIFHLIFKLRRKFGPFLFSFFFSFLNSLSFILQTSFKVFSLILFLFPFFLFEGMIDRSIKRHLIFIGRRVSDAIKCWHRTDRNGTKTGYDRSRLAIRFVITREVRHTQRSERSVLMAGGWPSEARGTAPARLADTQRRASFVAASRRRASISRVQRACLSVLHHLLFIIFIIFFLFFFCKRTQKERVQIPRLLYQFFCFRLFVIFFCFFFFSSFLH